MGLYSTVSIHISSLQTHTHLLVTDKQFMSVQNGVISKSTETIPLRDLKSVKLQESPLVKLTLTGGGDIEEEYLLGRGDGPEFTTALRNQISQART